MPSSSGVSLASLQDIEYKVSSFGGLSFTDSLILNVFFFWVG